MTLVHKTSTDKRFGYQRNQSSSVKIFSDKQLKTHYFLESGGSGVDDAIIASLQGLAAGTLLYVAMFEILSRERANQVLCSNQL